VYIDDFKMADPAENVPKAWAATRSKIKNEDPEPFGLFLGCRHEVAEVVVNGQKARTMTNNVEADLAASVER